MMFVKLLASVGLAGLASAETIINASAKITIQAANIREPNRIPQFGGVSDSLPSPTIPPNNFTPPYDDSVPDDIANNTVGTRSSR
jgi:hypothetical protein